MSRWFERVLTVRPTARIAVVGEDLYENIQWGEEEPIPAPELLAADAAIAEQEARQWKAAAIRTAFEAAAAAPVPVNGVNYHGGIDSALRLDGARRLALEAGLAEVTFYDLDNLPHVLTLAEALTVCLAVGARFQADYGRKQALMVELDRAGDAVAVNELIF